MLFVIKIPFKLVNPDLATYIKKYISGISFCGWAPTTFSSRLTKPNLGLLYQIDTQKS